MASYKIFMNIKLMLSCEYFNKLCVFINKFQKMIIMMDYQLHTIIVS